MFCTYLTQLFAFVVWQERSQALKTSIDALHPSSFIAIRNFASHTLLVFHGCCVASTTLFVSVITGENGNKNRKEKKEKNTHIIMIYCFECR